MMGQHWLFLDGQTHINTGIASSAAASRPPFISFFSYPTRMARRYGGGGGATATITSLQRCGERNVACIKGLAKYAPRDLLDALGEEEYNNISKDIRELSKDAAVIKYESAIADMQCRNLTENEIVYIMFLFIQPLSL